MEKLNFKCPICNNNEHYKINLLDTTSKKNLGDGFYDRRTVTTVPRTLIRYEIESYGDGGTAISFNAYADAYLCKKCGHIQLFGKQLLDQINSDDKSLNFQKKDIESKLNSINKQLSILLTKKEKIETRQDQINQLLNSEDITIRQQRELTEEAEQIRKDLKPLYREINPIKEEQEKYQSELDEIDLKLKNIATISKRTINK